MTQGKKMPAGVGSRGGHVHALMHREIVTQLGAFRVCDVLLLATSVTLAWAVCSGVLHLGYLIAKGLICFPW